jgi:hypothetical protein
MLGQPEAPSAIVSAAAASRSGGAVPGGRAIISTHLDQGIHDGGDGFGDTAQSTGSHIDQKIENGIGEDMRLGPRWKFECHSPAMDKIAVDPEDRFAIALSLFQTLDTQHGPGRMSLEYLR